MSESLTFIRKIGSGTYGVVLACKFSERKGHEEIVAVKVVNYETCLFQRELDNLRDINCLFRNKECPFVPYFYDWFEFDPENPAISGNDIWRSVWHEDILSKFRVKDEESDDSSAYYLDAAGLIMEHYSGMMLAHYIFAYDFGRKDWLSLAFQLIYTFMCLHNLGPEDDRRALLHRDVGVRNIIIGHIPETVYDWQGRRAVQDVQFSAAALPSSRSKNTLLEDAMRHPPRKSTSNSTKKTPSHSPAIKNLPCVVQCGELFFDPFDNRCHLDEYTKPRPYQSYNADTGQLHSTRPFCIKLIDYGMAVQREVPEILTAASRPVANLTGRPPEMFFFVDDDHGGSVWYSAASDVWSLGATLLNTAMCAGLQKHSRDLDVFGNDIFTSFYGEAYKEFTLAVSKIITHSNNRMTSVRMSCAANAHMASESKNHTNLASHIDNFWNCDKLKYMCVHVWNTVLLLGGLPTNAEWSGVENTLLYAVLQPIYEKYQSIFVQNNKYIKRRRERLCENLSEEQVQLLASMLQWDPRLRPTMAQLVHHPAFHEIMINPLLSKSHVYERYNVWQCRATGMTHNAHYGKHGCTRTRKSRNGFAGLFEGCAVGTLDEPYFVMPRHRYHWCLPCHDLRFIPCHIVVPGSKCYMPEAEPKPGSKRMHGANATEKTRDSSFCTPQSCLLCFL